jgi:hypothetical protein
MLNAIVSGRRHIRYGFNPTIATGMESEYTDSDK